MNDDDNQKLENAIRECERILSEALGFNVHCVNRSEVNGTPEDAFGFRAGNLDWYQFKDRFSLSLAFEGETNEHMAWVDRRG